MGAWIVVFFFVGLFIVAVVAAWRRERTTGAFDPYTGALITPRKPPPAGWQIVRRHLTAYVLCALLYPLVLVAAFVWWLAIPVLLAVVGVSEDWRPITRWLVIVPTR